MLRNNAEILFFFPLSFHNLASNKTMAMVTVVAIGTQKCQNSKGGEWSSLVELWFKVVGANSHYFFFFISLSSHHLVLDIGSKLKVCKRIQ